MRRNWENMKASFANLSIVLLKSMPSVSIRSIRDEKPSPSSGLPGGLTRELVYRAAVGIDTEGNKRVLDFEQKAAGKRHVPFRITYIVTSLMLHWEVRNTYRPNDRKCSYR